MATATKNRGAKRAGKKSVKSSRFHQKLGALTYYQACRLLGDEGSRLIQQAGRTFDLVGDRDVYLGGDLYRVRVHDAEIEGGMAIATVTLSSDRKKGLAINCEQCEMPCLHLAAAFDFLLDAKTDLGLAMPPDEDVPLENLTVEELKARAMADRQKRAAEETMRVRSINRDSPWTDYVVTSESSGRTYRVAVRSPEGDDSFCTCPDFRTNRLGTCKHVMHVRNRIAKKFSAAQRRAPYYRKRVSVAVCHSDFEGDRPAGLQISCHTKRPVRAATPG